MIGTKDILRFLNRTYYKNGGYSSNEAMEYIGEIVARLERYDKLCHDLKQMIAAMSNTVDVGTDL